MSYKNPLNAFPRYFCTLVAYATCSVRPADHIFLLHPAYSLLLKLKKPKSTPVRQLCRFCTHTKPMHESVLLGWMDDLRVSPCCLPRLEYKQPYLIRYQIQTTWLVMRQSWQLNTLVQSVIPAPQIRVLLFYLLPNICRILTELSNEVRNISAVV